VGGSGNAGVRPYRLILQAGDFAGRSDAADAGGYVCNRNLAVRSVLTAAASEQDRPPSEQQAGSGSISGSAKAAAGPIAGVWGIPKTLLWGLVVGLTNISGMMLIMPAFRLGVTGLVSAVVAMNVVFVLLYARFGLKERFSPLEVGGLICACAGILILRLAG
jgi:drug/metabolite transporter (DMT)-like permease